MNSKQQPARRAAKWRLSRRSTDFLFRIRIVPGQHRSVWFQ